VYDPYRNRFLVVWDEYYCSPTVPVTCNYVIQGRLLYGTYQSSGNHFPGDDFRVASQWSQITSSYDLRDPAVAYNADDHRFAVVFKQGRESSRYSSIYGQMLSSDKTEPTQLGPDGGFEIRSYGSDRTVRTPDAAWSSDGSTFLAAWTVERDADTNYIAIGYLYDTYQGGGTQVYGTWWLAPYDRGDDPLTYDCSAPAVAYDPVAEAYVVAFNHKEGTGGLSPQTVHGQRVRPQYDSGTFRYDADYAFAIETNVSGYTGHLYPDIAFSGVGDEMHVVYMSYLYIGVGANEYWIYDRTLHGTSVGSRPRVRHVDDSELTNPAVAGSQKGRCLVVWSETDPAYGDWDIFGWRVSPYWVFIPAAFNDY